MPHVQEILHAGMYFVRVLTTPARALVIKHALADTDIFPKYCFKTVTEPDVVTRERTTVVWIAWEFWEELCNS